MLSLACVERNQLLDALKRSRRALRAGGRLMITEPAHTGFLHRSLKLSLREFLSVMKEAVFEVKTHCTFGPRASRSATSPGRQGDSNALSSRTGGHEASGA